MGLIGQSSNWKRFLPKIESKCIFSKLPHILIQHVPQYSTMGVNVINVFNDQKLELLLYVHAQPSHYMGGLSQAPLNLHAPRELPRGVQGFQRVGVDLVVFFRNDCTEVCRSSSPALHFTFPGTSSTGSEPEGNQRHALTYDDLVEGTERFNHRLQISEGSFSDTYKGTVGSETFAVKLFKTVNTLLKMIGAMITNVVVVIII